MRETAQRILSDNRTLQIKMTLEMIEAALVDIAKERDALIWKLAVGPFSETDQRLLVVQDLLIDAREEYLLNRKRSLNEELERRGRAHD